MLKPVGTLLAALVLAGCGASPAATAPGTSPQGAPATASGTAPVESSPARKVIEISLTGGRVDPNGERVVIAKGTVLELVISSDHADEVHVHGYDVEVPVRAGVKVTRDITLDQVGRFEVESHEPQLTILQLVVS